MGLVVFFFSRCVVQPADQPGHEIPAKMSFDSHGFLLKWSLENMIFAVLPVPGLLNWNRFLSSRFPFNLKQTMRTTCLFVCMFPSRLLLFLPSWTPFDVKLFLDKILHQLCYMVYPDIDWIFNIPGGAYFQTALLPGNLTARPPENRSSWKEGSLPTIIFNGVKLQRCIFCVYSHEIYLGWLSCTAGASP